MAMYKAAQFADDLVISLPVEPTGDDVEPNDEDNVVLYSELPNEEQVVEMHAPDAENEVSFSLSFLPGAPDEVVEVSEDDLEVEPKDEKEKPKNSDKNSDKKEDKDYQSVPKKDFLNWVHSYLQKIPKHKGETIALERAMSYLKRGLDILSKSVQQDFDGEIDISKAEDARIQMENGISRLDKELQKRRKQAYDKRISLTKEGQKVAGVGMGGVIVTVPLIVSSIARVCINSTISGGKDIEDTFKRLAEKYKLTDREKVETIQLISDMGYVMRRDRGFMVDDEEKYNYSSENNYDFPPNYYS